MSRIRARFVLPLVSMLVGPSHQAMDFRCPGATEIAEEFMNIDQLDYLTTWQVRYGRNSLSVSRDFFEGAYQPSIHPHLEELKAICPGTVAQFMLNSILAVDTDQGVNEARELFRLFEEIVVEYRDHPQMIDLIDDLARGDVATEYPMLLNGRTNGCYDSDLKVYVYDTGELTKWPIHCSIGQWGVEVLIHKFFENAACRTEDPEEADFFFVPIYSTCHTVFHSNNNDTATSRYHYDPLMEIVLDQPWWRRRDGMDHMFLFADGDGPRIFAGYDYIRSSAIFLQVESICPTWDEPTDRLSGWKSCFSRWKDIIIPGHTDVGRVKFMNRHGTKPASERSLIATFHGRHYGIHDSYKNCVVRRRLIQLVQGNLPGFDVGGFVGDYLERMGDAIFCLVPVGTSPWTNHLYESFFAGCIPVIISDLYEMPFQEFLDWSEFSIKWPESMADHRLYDHLISYNMVQLEDMQKRVREVECWFNYYSKDPNCSPFLGILRQLEIRKQRFPSYSGKWWAGDLHQPWVERDGRPTVNRIREVMEDPEDQKKCLHPDVTFTNATVIHGYWKGTHFWTEDAWRCQWRCHEHNHCFHFTWYPETQGCIMYNADALDEGFVPATGAVSGPKYCNDLLYQDDLGFLRGKGEQTEKLMNANVAMQLDEQGRKVVAPLSAEL